MHRDLQWHRRRAQSAVIQYARHQCQASNIALGSLLQREAQEATASITARLQGMIPAMSQGLTTNSRVTANGGHAICSAGDLQQVGQTASRDEAVWYLACPKAGSSNPYQPFQPNPDELGLPPAFSRKVFPLQTVGASLGVQRRKPPL